MDFIPSIDLALVVFNSLLIASILLLFIVLWPVFTSYLSPTGRRVRKLINMVPGPPFLPIVGNTLQFMVSREKVVEVRNKHFSSYSKLFKIWSFHYPLVKPVGPDYVEAILHSSKNIEKSIFYKLLHPWLGMGLLTSSGDKWFSHRKILTPAFHFKILEEFVALFIEKSASLIDKLSIEARSGNPFNIVPIVSHCTLDIICESAMGIKLNVEDKTQRDYMAAVYTLGDIVYYRSMRPWLMVDWIFALSKRFKEQKDALRILHSFTEGVIKEKKNEYLEKKLRTINGEEILTKRKKTKAFLDLLIELSLEKNLFSDEEIREQVDTFMFAGHDTTAMGISWSLFVLANHPEIQEKIWEEVNAAWENKNKEDIDRNSESKLNFFNEMTYLDRCIKECLRLYPSAPVISRKLTEDLQMGEYLIPVNTIIHIHITNIHRNPEIYPDPDKFDPDRFLPEAVSRRHPYAYIPFSAGPRNCIGQRFAILELKALLSAIIRNFHVIAVDKPNDITIIADLVLRAKEGIRIKLVPRKKMGGLCEHLATNTTFTSVHTPSSISSLLGYRQH